jgi:site-specific recombinase
LDKAIHHIDHNLGFWVGNTVLGFYLGSAAAIGKITGLPLDTRHITFSSAQFGMAMASLKSAVPFNIVIAIAVSVFVMGLINLTVSFSLTLFVTMKSRSIRFSQAPQLLKLLGKKLLTRPLDFILPLRDPP